MGTIGIFGGTFDPIHFGHLITAQKLLESRKLSRIFFVPANISPHKVKYYYSEPEHRYNMTKAAISSYPYFDISDFEIKRGDISYTYDTLFEFKKTYDDIELIIGFDNLITFDMWHRADDIIQLCNIVVLKRTYDKEIKKTNKFFGFAEFVDSPIIEISSTEIRERVKRGLPIDFFVPADVKEYITKNKLYLTY